MPTDDEPGPRSPRRRRQWPRISIVMFAVGSVAGGINMITFRDPAAYAFFGTPVAAAIAMFVDESRRPEEARA